MNKNEVQVVPNGNESLGVMPTQNTGVANVFADPKSFEIALRMAECLSSSTVVPKEYQNNNGNCMIAIEMAARINTSPLMVMQNLYIVNGKPAWSAQWIISMINSSKKYKTELQFEFGNDPEDGGLSCRAWVEDWNGHKVSGPKVTMNMANSEGWVNKNGSKWKTMPEVMIQYRAASFFGRMNCPDMIMGIYSQDEITEMEDANDSCGFAIDTETGTIVEISDDRVITQEERQELFKIAKEELGGEDANSILKNLLEMKGLESTNGMTLSVMNEIVETIRTLGTERRASSAPETSNDERKAE